MKRRSMLIPVTAMAAIVAVSPAAAVADGNGWSCISPFTTYTNGTYPDDPPALNHIIDSLAISVTRNDSSALTAVPGQTLPLRDLSLSLTFTDTRPVEQMYRRTGGASYGYRGIPYGQVEDNERNLAIRVNPADNLSYWSWTAGATTNYVQAVNPANPSEPPKVRTADTAENTTWFYPAPTLAFAHRYLSHTGNSQFPLDASVAIAASNTVEKVQTVSVKGYWTVNIKDATPGSADHPRELQQRRGDGHRRGGRARPAADELDPDGRRPGRVHGRAAGQHGRRHGREQGL